MNWHCNVLNGTRLFMASAHRTKAEAEQEARDARQDFRRGQARGHVPKGLTYDIVPCSKGPEVCCACWDLENSEAFRKKRMLS